MNREHYYQRLLLKDYIGMADLELQDSSQTTLSDIIREDVVYGGKNEIYNNLDQTVYIITGNFTVVDTNSFLEYYTDSNRLNIDTITDDYTVVWEVNPNERVYLQYPFHKLEELSENVDISFVTSEDVIVKPFYPIYAPLIRETLPDEFYEQYTLRTNTSKFNEEQGRELNPNTEATLSYPFSNIDERALTEVQEDLYSMELETTD